MGHCLHYTISIVGRVFHSLEANNVRDEALRLAALTLNIFASADEYEQHIGEHPAEFAQWKKKNNASVRQAASVSIQITCDTCCCGHSMFSFLRL